MEKKTVNENEVTFAIKDFAALFSEFKRDLSIDHERFIFLMKALSKAIDELYYEEKVVLSLYHCEELSVEEIGEILGITQSKVYQIYFDAVLNLKSKVISFAENDLTSALF